MPSRKAVIAIIGLLVIAAALAAHHFRHRYQLEKALQRARDAAKVNYWALALENIDHDRYELTHTLADCDLLGAIYTNVQKAERLEWAAEACLDHGIESVSTYMNLARAYELYGRDDDAIRLLNQIAQKFDKDDQAYRRMIAIFNRKNDQASAEQAIIAAAGRTIDAQIGLAAVRILLKQKRGEEAAKLARPMGLMETKNPEVKLIVARAFMAGHDIEAAQGQVEIAKMMMNSVSPHEAERLRREYADVFKINALK